MELERIAASCPSPVVAISGAFAVFLSGCGVARLWSAQQIEALRERLALAQEKASAAQDKAIALTEQIQSNAGQADLLKSANSTVAAIDQISIVTQPSATRNTPQSGTDLSRAIAYITYVRRSWSSIFNVAA